MKTFATPAKDWKAELRKFISYKKFELNMKLYFALFY